LENLKVGAKQSHRNMTLYCLLAAQDSDVDFLTLDEALESRSVSITQVDEAGSVPQLKVTNKSDKKVLMLDGEERVAVKQNRVLKRTHCFLLTFQTCIGESASEVLSSFQAVRAQQFLPVQPAYRSGGESDKEEIGNVAKGVDFGRTSKCCQWNGCGLPERDQT
jgi:hypothetical protein